MTATPTTPSTALRPQQWLVVSTSGDRLMELRRHLVASPSLLTAWRLGHGLVHLLPPTALAAALQAAWEAGAPLVRLHSDIPRRQLEPLLASTLAAAGGPLDWVPWQPADTPALLAELAEPDHWVAMAWADGGGHAVPPLQPAAGLPGAAAAHEQAFAQWSTSPAAQQALALARDLASALATAQALLAEDEQHLPPQPTPHEPGTEAWHGLPLAPPGAAVQPPPAGGLRAMAAAGAGSTADTWRQVQVWAPATQRGRPWRSEPTWEARLLALGQGPATRLKLQLHLLDPAAWQGTTGLQAWLFPPLLRPVLCSLGDAANGRPFNGALVLESPLNTHGRNAEQLAQALLAAELRLDWPGCAQ